MTEKELYGFWDKYINRNLYHVISTEYLTDVKKYGLIPKKDPHKSITPKIKRFFRLVQRLEKRGFIHTQYWGKKKVDSIYIIMVSLEDLGSDFIDFTPDFKETFYYRRLKGGALVQTIKIIVKDLNKKNVLLTKSEIGLVEDLKRWAKEKSSHKSRTVIIKGSTNSLKSALFQVKFGKRTSKKYLPSPFGSFEHFRTIISKNGLNRYEKYLIGEKLFYLRVSKKIASEDIIRIF